MKHHVNGLLTVVVVVALVSAARSSAAAAGEGVVVARQAAPLMRGWNTLAIVPQGQRLNVLQTEGAWVGTSVVLNGQTVSGWVHNRQVATPAQYAAQKRTTRRSYSFQPGPAAGTYSPPARGSSRSSSRGLIMGATPYGPSYWRADRKIMGD